MAKSIKQLNFDFKEFRQSLIIKEELRLDEDENEAM